MIFFHGTTEERWTAMQAEGVLHGVRDTGCRVTYLAAERDEAECYGDVVLAVDYEPGTHHDNWAEGCWQARVYGPIPLRAVRRL